MKNNEDFIIGRHPVVAALRNPNQDINKVFLQSGISKDDETVRTILTLAKGRHLVISNVPKSKLDLMSDHQNHQGVMLQLQPLNMQRLMIYLKMLKNMMNRHFL